MAAAASDRLRQPEEMTMAVIKVENADPHSSIPLVFDIMGDATSKEPTATHRLTFGDFVLIGSLDNLHMVTVEEWQARQTEEAEAKAAEEKAAQEQQATTLSSAATDYADATAPGKLKRNHLEEMTKDQLQEVADDRDIEVSSHWTKADMVDAILKGQ